MNVTRGRIFVQRFFDIAEEVDLQRAEALVAALSRRPRFVGTARHIELPSPPLEMTMGTRPMGLPQTDPSEVWMRLYHVGALVVTFVVDIPAGTNSETLILLAARISDHEDAITQAASQIAEEIRTAIKPACKMGESSALVEDYTIFYLRNTEPACDADTIGHHLDIPRLLLGETGPIVQAERLQMVHASFSYRPEDLLVVDWNSALIMDPSGALDVAELLELTSVQMLELRAYDNIVGRALDGLYSELDHKQSGIFRSSRYSRLSRRIMRLYVDVIEITERIDNSLTFLGDTWLARVHRAAVAEFGIPHWQRQLRNKLELLRQINQLLVDQITSQKTLSIETAVAGLIILEIIVAALKVF